MADPSAALLWGPAERILTPRRGIDETVITLDGDNDRVDVPVAVAANRSDDGRIVERRSSMTRRAICQE